MSAIRFPRSKPSFILWEGQAVSTRFPYLQVLLQGRPRHFMDEFSFRHPQMERGRRAKIFAPFDALDGFGGSISDKNAVYVDKIELDEEQRQELNRRLLLLRAQEFKLLQSRAEEQGVFTLEKPTTPRTLETAIHWMFTARQRLRRLEQKTQSLEEKMQEIRIVNRAKWLLIGQLGMTEADAHRYLEKQAMDRCVSRRTIAEEIIRIYDA